MKGFGAPKDSIIGIIMHVPTRLFASHFVASGCKKVIATQKRKIQQALVKRGVVAAAAAVLERFFTSWMHIFLLLARILG
jgi:hypothetical protein